jgi:hypothetical protein
MTVPLIVGLSSSAVAVIAWLLYLRWLLPRVVKPTLSVFAANIFALLCLGPGMLWLLIYTLDALSITVPSERHAALYTYYGVVAVLALFTLIRVCQGKKSTKKA